MAIEPLHFGSKNHELSIFIIFSSSLLLNPFPTKGHGRWTTCMPDLTNHRSPLFFFS
ncbi:hypothetical protein SLEP1_g58850 [Rubroshorea leprosula]|uniref:Uncharacterized protein n=1 Tax=Rubroshorea leprosula TaxID=152421 RepID=A0AAV5MRU3_9ROSI|nr:hypothetical protein SLEP1_g58850 [Rubroshorea leprosula]